jgi:pyocin large subunit-like protein
MGMNRALRSFLLALACLILGTWLLCSPRQEPPADRGSAPTAATPTAAAPTAASPTPGAVASVSPAAPTTPANPRGFRSRERLDDHFARHGAEFGVTTAAEYVALAQALRDAPVGGDILEIVRGVDGVISRFDRRTGAFLAADPDGTIRTFFKPNDGEAYFRRQARRAPRS